LSQKFSAKYATFRAENLPFWRNLRQNLNSMHISSVVNLHLYVGKLKIYPSSNFCNPQLTGVLYPSVHVSRSSYVSVSMCNFVFDRSHPPVSGDFGFGLSPAFTPSPQIQASQTAVTPISKLLCPGLVLIAA